MEELVKWIDEQARRREEIIGAPRAANTEVPLMVQLAEADARRDLVILSALRRLAVAK